MTDKDKMHEAVYSYMQTDACKYAVLNCNYSLLIIAGWQAAKESDRKELEASNLRAANAELMLKMSKESEECHAFNARAANKAYVELDAKLEAAKQMIAELEEANTSNAFWKAEFLKEKEALEKKLATFEALAHQYYYELPAAFISSYTSNSTEELTKLLVAARKEGFEEGKQSGRDELQKELSELEPVWWLSEGKMYKVQQRDDAGFGDYYPNQTPLIPRPLPPQVKGE